MRTFYFLLVSQTFLKAEHLLTHSHATFLLMLLRLELHKGQLIIEKSRGEVSPMGQDTIENVS